MRDAFHRELESLDQEIVRMGALVEQSTQMATTALMEGDQELAQRVRDGDEAIDDVFMDIEKRSLALLAQQAPVAGDLRLIVAILRVVNDLERAGDLAYNIAKLAQGEDFRQSGSQRSASAGLGAGPSGRPAHGRGHRRVGRQGRTSGGRHRSARTTRSDDLHARLIEKLVELKGQESLGPALRLALVGRYFERIGDHAVNLGERVRYFVTGDEEHLG